MWRKAFHQNGNYNYKSRKIYVQNTLIDLMYSNLDKIRVHEPLTKILKDM